jgi:cell division septum initiation protein DivIVA
MSVLINGASSLDGVLELVMLGGPEFVARLKELNDAIEDLNIGKDVVRLREEANLTVQQSNSLRVEAESVLSTARVQAEKMLKEAKEGADEILTTARANAVIIRNTAEAEVSAFRDQAMSEINRMRTETIDLRREAQDRVNSLGVEQELVAGVIQSSQAAQREAEAALQRWNNAVASINAVIEAA